jgi:hypothetical protein
MGKKPSSFRTTISVPRDLKRRMEAVKEGINWSAIACRAFEDKLAEVATNKEEKTMAAVIQRLRATKPDALYQQGYEDGRYWASERAGYEDLVRLEQLYVKRRAERDFDFGAWRGVCELFWDCIVGGDRKKVDDPSYVRGFAEGVLALWSEVKDYL